MAKIATGRDAEGYATTATIIRGDFTITQHKTYGGFKEDRVVLTESQARKMAKSILAELEKSQ